MTFYSTIRKDFRTVEKSSELLHFAVEADSAADAVRILGAYCKGMYEASGNGGEILSVTKSKTRGVEYRGL